MFKGKEDILNHTKVHNGSMFIKCDSDIPVYSFKGGLFMRPSLYLNYLGLPYTTLLKAEDFNLDQSTYGGVIRSKIL